MLISVFCLKLKNIHFYQFFISKKLLSIFQFNLNYWKLNNLCYFLNKKNAAIIPSIKKNAFKFKK